MSQILAAAKDERVYPEQATVTISYDTRDRSLARAARRPFSIKAMQLKQAQSIRDTVKVTERNRITATSGCVLECFA